MIISRALFHVSFFFGGGVTKNDNTRHLRYVRAAETVDGRKIHFQTWVAQVVELFLFLLCVVMKQLLLKASIMA